MPRAAHGVTHHQSFVKRPTQMAASGADSEDLVTAAGEQRPCTADMAYFHAAIGYLGHRNASDEIGSEVGRFAQDFLYVLPLGPTLGCGQRFRLQNQQLRRGG
jgi:hypothetical protein